MGLEIIILSEISQRKKNIWYHSYVESLKSGTKEHTYKEKYLAVIKGERWGEGQIRSLGLTYSYYYI